MNDRILGPTSEINLTTLLDRMKRETMYAINCVMIGTIQSYNTATNMASISINFKRDMANGDVLKYPKLEDCPVFILHGGDAQISMPIGPGDQCLVLFNDRNIDDWYLSGEVKVPHDTRCHNIADGIALVGIRNLKTAKFTPVNSICIDGGSKKVAIKNTSANLKTILLKLIDCILAIQVIDIGTPAAPAGTWGLTGTTGPSGLATLKTDIANLLDEGLT